MTATSKLNRLSKKTIVTNDTILSLAARSSEISNHKDTRIQGLQECLIPLTLLTLKIHNYNKKFIIAKMH